MPVIDLDLNDYAKQIKHFKDAIDLVKKDRHEMEDKLIAFGRTIDDILDGYRCNINIKAGYEGNLSGYISVWIKNDKELSKNLLDKIKVLKKIDTSSHGLEFDDAEEFPDGFGDYVPQVLLTYRRKN